MSKTNLGLVAFCEQALENGTGYVYGTIGQICTASLLDQCAARYPDSNLAGGAMRTVGEKWIGKRVTDCIGLLKYYVMSDGYGKNPVYNSRYDKSANGAYNEAATKGSISSLPEIPGICLHMDGHFGVYIGGGYAIEARGTAYGVVKTKVAGRGWTAWFKSPWITYVSSTADPGYCDTTMPFSKRVGETYQFKTGSDIWPGTAGVWERVSQTVGADGYYYTKFKALRAGGAGFYMKVNGKNVLRAVGTVK